MKDYKYKIEGLDCANCANLLEESLRKAVSYTHLTLPTT